MSSGAGRAPVLAEIQALARPLRTDRDLNGLVRRAAQCRFVAIGEASHGTHEFAHLDVGERGSCSVPGLATNVESPSPDDP